MTGEANIPKDPAGRIEVSPDPRKLRDGLAKRRGWRRRLFIRRRQPASVPGFTGDPPEEVGFHFNRAVADLVAELKGAKTDPETAKLVLEEARAIFNEPVARIDSAERRATTLQGTVAIAGSLVVGGAGLFLDSSKIHGQGWRIAVAALIAGFLICLVGCAVRALGATSRIFQFEQPGVERLAERARMGDTDAALHAAAELLRASSVADEIAGVKVGLMGMAAWWFRHALLILVLLAVLLSAYAVAHGDPPQASPVPGTTVAAASASAK